MCICIPICIATYVSMCVYLFIIFVCYYVASYSVYDMS